MLYHSVNKLSREAKYLQSLLCSEQKFKKLYVGDLDLEVLHFAYLPQHVATVAVAPPVTFWAPV